ncbi:MAG: biosynthetic-type acetolactate synthase large subunit [Actinobacteria bacterium]|nr:biosynthetic-type acetolactate synthase large subunit [Actinomycetota bacterium]MBM3698004.1 biosynthetic-type acetolactate synthase large subunit [Actinomycetota bacterium]
MRGVDATLEILKRNGVDAIFGIPGGPLIPLFDALFDDSDLRLFLTRHEQGAGHMAEGYAKASGRLAVCTGTSGPGATNLVTPITDAYMDSVPMLALTGQVGSTRVGTDAFQEADIVGISLPVVKHSWLVKDAHELPTVLEEAIYVATTGRPGPVLVDVCVDQWAVEVDDYAGPFPPEMPGYRPPASSGHPRQLQAAARAIAESTKPMLYAGGGIIASNAAEELTRMAEVAQIPVTTTLMGIGGFPASNPLFVGMPGMHGIAASTFAMQESDLILAVGVRFDERVLSTVMNEWAPNAKIIHIDVDPAEIGKNRAAHIGIAGEAKAVLDALADAYVQQESRHDDAARAAWMSRINAWLEEYPYTIDDDEPGVIAPQNVIRSVYDITGGDAIVATEVGQHQMWAAQFYPFEKPRRWITSGGLGTMGFGLPAALGAQVAFPDELVVDIAGDGSFEMTLQELSTAQTYGLPVKIVILNNGFLGMVRQWQELFWDKRYSNTSFGEFQPDFAALAGAYGIPGMRIEDPDELEDALRETLSTDGPALIDIQVNRDAKVFPMVPQGKGPDAMLVRDPAK